MAGAGLVRALQELRQLGAEATPSRFKENRMKSGGTEQVLFHRFFILPSPKQLRLSLNQLKKKQFCDKI